MPGSLKCKSLNICFNVADKTEMDSGLVGELIK